MGLAPKAFSIATGGMVDHRSAKPADRSLRQEVPTSYKESRPGRRRLSHAPPRKPPLWRQLLVTSSSCSGASVGRRISDRSGWSCSGPGTSM
jgi:hypothetical protein